MAAEQNALAAARPFAELLREHRLAAGIGQEALAERARLSVETVSALERGVRQRPYRETIALLAQALGLSDEDRAGLERAAKRNSVRTLAAIEPADNNLPVQLSSFVGRDRDVANVEELLAAHRLITLVGAGGVGKTRLALAVCEQLPGRHDSVWFVDFSSYADVATIPTAIASGVGLSNVSQLDRLIAYLRPKNALLVLDNCEHLIEGVAQTVTALLRSSPDLQVMATSRQALAIAGERVYRVPPLSFLGIECDPPTVGEAMKYGAIELFVERAKGADSRFELSERNVGPVAEIVRRLDGIALAIELAAARTNVFSPSSIARRIEEHVLSLTGGSRAPLPRQKTMHSVLEWSYNLLDAHERRFFQRLSVFAGSFSLELATVTLPAGDDSPAVVDVLASLVDKSLVQNEPLRDVVRYRLLEPIRQYAREKLREEGEEWEAARAHAVALLTLAERYDGPPEITPDSVWYTQLEPERENYRAAFDWALSSAGDARIAQRLAGSRTATSFGAGEALRWTEAALATSDAATPKNVVAKLETSHARTILVLYGDPKPALAAAERALALRTDDPRTFAEAHLHAGLSLLRAGSVTEGAMRMRKALAAASRGPYNRLIALIVQSLATAYAAAGNFAAAREASWEALRLFRAAGSHRLAALNAPNLAEFEFAEGHTATALELTLESVAYFREHRVWSELGWALGNVSAYLIAEDRFDEARTHARESLVLACESRHGAWLALALQHLAAVAALDPNRARELQSLFRAANLLGYVNESAAHAGFRRETTEQREYERIVPILREKLGTRFDQLLNAGSSWPEDRAVAEALGMP